MSAGASGVISAEQRAAWSTEHARSAPGGKLGGAEFKALLPPSALSLPPAELAHLWTLADRDKDGTLNLQEYLIARALVEARLQGTPLPAVLPELYLDTPSPSGPPSSYATIAPASMQQYSQTFSSVQQGGRVAGAAAAALFGQSGLSAPLLAEVWRLADRDTDNALNEAEFVLAMHLIRTHLDTRAPLPPQVPAALLRALGLPFEGGPSQALVAVGASSPTQPQLAVPRLPPAPDLAVDERLFVGPPKPAPPGVESTPFAPWGDEELVVHFGVSDVIMAPYKAAADLARLPTEVVDPETGGRVLQQSEPELLQLVAALERAEGLRAALQQRHVHQTEQMRQGEQAATQLLNVCGAAEQQTGAAAEELHRLQAELRALVAEVQQTAATLQQGVDLGAMRAQAQQLVAERAQVAAQQAAIVPEGQQLIAQLAALTGQPLAPPSAGPGAGTGLQGAPQTARPQEEEEGSEEEESEEERPRKPGPTQPAAMQLELAQPKKKKGLFGRKK